MGIVSGGRLRNEAEFFAAPNRRSAAVHTELGVDALGVGPDGAQPHDQLVGDTGAIKVGGEKPQDIKFSLAERLHQALTIDRTAVAASECVEQASHVLRRDATTGRHPEHVGNRGALGHECSDVALRLCQRQRATERIESRNAAPAVVLGERLQDEDLDDAAPPSARFGGDQQTLKERDRFLDPARVMGPGALGQEHSGKGDVLVLADVSQVVFDRQSALADPGFGLAQSALRCVDPRCLGRDGPGNG